MAERVKFWTRWPMVLWLAAVWVLLWGDLTVANVVVGLVLAVLLVTLLRMPKVGFEGRPWLPGIVVLVVWFLGDVVMASVQVAKKALSPGEPPHGAVIRVRLRSHSDLFLTITAQLCSLVPGSIIVEAHRLTGTLYVHVFDVAEAGGIDGARDHCLKVERRVLYAFATDEALAEAGLPPRRRLLRRRPAAEVTR
ncbi:Na+/H+ antiporter subunit E [Pseudactinotalea suaedae]|uniref:Na+/H+ antiporter subunit E n=1 Tax=Pseudactinotalea suaedae TaxID=1524924 RepID=UPI001F4F74B4|nr:Na+/H+ antiporter subunit E [Pseudactinotalea suaedae]